MHGHGTGHRVAVKAISGSLVSLDLFEALGGSPGADSRSMRGILTSAAARLGPASGARQVFDLLAAPALTQAGGAISIVESTTAAVTAAVAAGGTHVATLAASGWNGDLRRLRHATAPKHAAPRWWIGTNGVTIRVLDATRAYAHRTIDIDVETLAGDDTALAAVQHLLDLRSTPAFDALAALVSRSETHRADVGRSLQSGVETALVSLVGGFAGSRRRTGLDAALADALTVVYRILFLLFAEARGLVPQWHPIYRDSYTIEALRPIVEGRRAPAGVWQSLQAIARLAHRGCTAGSLRVTPFNGRLFAPAAAPLAESMPLDDRVIAGVLLAVTTRPSADRRERISYADLGVEQLGSVYERISSTPARAGDGSRWRRPTPEADRHVLTPRAMTESRSPDARAARPRRIARADPALRVLDPSMGSGAFLVAACRYLAGAYEAALIEEGTMTRADVTAADRAAFRRAVAQRCVYGVDANPTAVQLARLSLWLCTLAADRPLTFLDHRLRAGNSLAGASIAEVTSRPPGPFASRRRRQQQAWLFDERAFAAVLSSAVGVRLRRRDDPTIPPPSSAGRSARSNGSTASAGRSGRGALADAGAPHGSGLRTPRASRERLAGVERRCAAARAGCRATWRIAGGRRPLGGPAERFTGTSNSPRSFTTVAACRAPMQDSTRSSAIRRGPPPDR